MKLPAAIWICCLALCAGAQPSPYNFHKLGLADGLHDGTIRRIGQDKFGFIWICSVGALNRYDGKNVVQYIHRPGDSTSPYSSQPRSVHTDSSGGLWFGFETGLASFDFGSQQFRRWPVVEGEFISRIESLGDSALLLCARTSLIRFHPATGEAFYYSRSDEPRHAALRENFAYDVCVRNDKVYIATARGLVLMDRATEATTPVPIPEFGGGGIYAVDVDAQHNIWLGTHQRVKLMKLHADLKTREIYDRFLSSEINTQPLNLMDILVDDRQRVWVVTAIDGLLQYRPETNDFVKHLHNSNLPSTPSSNNYRCIFQDDRGIIWLGCDYVGVNFFDPDKTLFRTLLPFADSLDVRARGVGRAVTQDSKGFIWMGNHDGVSRYDPRNGTYRSWRNEKGKPPVLYNNVVRSIHADDEDNIWIGTASGVNRYLAASGRIEFIPAEQLPHAFYNSITQDRAGNVWFCSNSAASLEWYQPSDKTFHSITDHPQLKPYAGVTSTSYVMEDSSGRLWISYARRGVLMLDKKTGRVTHYQASDSTDNDLIGNQVVDIKEDLDGKIWITTFNGVTCFDPDKNSFHSLSIRDGLPGNWIASAVVDNRNRVWLGINGGLTMIHADRKGFTRFTLGDGLPSIGFPEHAGIKLASGDIMMATYQGYLHFDPDDYTEKQDVMRFYLNGYSAGQQYHYLSPDMSDKHRLHFGSHENSFTFHLTGINYLKPNETWFAYKLEGFENDWHYTQDPKAVYTNVPGGSYRFVYKAAVTNGGWDDVTPQTLSVSVDTIFYKSAWFWGLLLSLFAGALYALYRYRTRQARELWQLKGQTQMLEKEKAVVMFESLKQQLNPHFLFNSLTSLSGLIETDPREAGDFLEQMSSIYRYILQNSNLETVNLQDELNFVRIYIDLQQTRFSRGLQVHIDVPDEYRHYKIAPVTLQNLIENAIKHNVIDADSPLVITISVEGDYLLVRNNLQKKNVVETSNKRGLAQFTTLYRYLTEKPVLIEEAEGYFTVKVPLI